MTQSMTREFGIHSVAAGALFVAMLGVAILVDLAGLLQFSGLVSSLPARILEVGAAISAACIFPLLALGMFVSADLNHKR